MKLHPKTQAAKARRANKAVLQMKAIMRDARYGELDIAEKAATILASCVARAATARTEHLQRVTLTLGILRTVRYVLRKLNEGAATWTGDLTVVSSIDEAASWLSEHILGLMPPETKLRSTYGMPTFLADLRFAPEPGGDEPVPFGPDFPAFEPEDPDRRAMEEMFGDIAEMYSIGLPQLADVAPEEQTSTASTNLVTLLVLLVALGKCALVSWRPEQRAFLDFIACTEVDHEFFNPDGSEKD